VNDIKLIHQAPDLIGECPRWDEREQRLYWTDINGQAIRRYHPASGSFESFQLPEPVGCFSFRESGAIVAGTRTGFAFIDLEANEFERLANPLPDDPSYRMNDGRCDFAGRFWAGSIRVPLLDQPVGKHFRLDINSIGYKCFGSAPVVVNAPPSANVRVTAVSSVSTSKK
jgi:sugar lactone lactonase YvrE